MSREAVELVLKIHTKPSTGRQPSRPSREREAPSGRGTGSGVTLEQSLAQVATVQQGKVIEIREYFSREEALEAMGVQGGKDA